MVHNPGLDFAVFPMQYFKEKPGDSNKIFNIYSSNIQGYLHLFFKDNPPLADHVSNMEEELI